MRLTRQIRFCPQGYVCSQFGSPDRPGDFDRGHLSRGGGQAFSFGVASGIQRLTASTSVSVNLGPWLYKTDTVRGMMQKSFE